MKTINELIMELIKTEFNRNQLNLNDSNSSDNVWLMCAALIPFSENNDAAGFLPTHFLGTWIMIKLLMKKYMMTYSKQVPLLALFALS